MRIKYYEDAKENATFERCTDVIVNVNILLYKKRKIFLYNYRCYASAS